MAFAFPKSKHQSRALWKPDFSSASHKVPHTHEAGDDYYIGDVYEPSRIGQSGELIEKQLVSFKSPAPTSRPYMKYLESLAHGWPHVSYLADFMKVTTAPPKQRLLTEQDRREKASRTKVAMLTFAPNTPVQRVDYLDINDLSDALNGPLSGQHNDVFARLFVLEDLSRDVIEAFGARFDVDPLFFRGHISDYMWYNTRDPWVELPDLDIMCRKRSYLHVRYIQTRYFRTQDSLRRAKWESGGFNVLRRVDGDGNWVTGLDIPNSDVGLIRSKTSLWIRPNKPGEKGVLGILLVDPTISEGFTLWGGYRNFDDCPSMANPVPKGPPRSSAFEDVIHYTSSLTPEEVTCIPKDPRVLFKKALLIVCAEWSTLVRYATTRITQLEWEIENPNLQGHIGGLQVTINKLHTWRRRLPIFRTFVSEVMENVIKRESFMASPENLVADLQKDFEILLSNIDTLQVRADRVMAVVTAVMSIDESKKAFEQNRSLARLTWLAITFAPLSFITGLFSMNGELATLLRTFKVYFAVALPLTAIILFLMRFANVGLRIRWKELFFGTRMREPRLAPRFNTALWPE